MAEASVPRHKRKYERRLRQTTDPITILETSFRQSSLELTMINHYFEICEAFGWLPHETAVATRQTLQQKVHSIRVNLNTQRRKTAASVPTQ